ncbi:MAG: zf-TFIIB domain-containing protein [Ignavibacteriaceae bacterium]|nr:zf-TFIIB domain-containing protein [Ignavibacteriaceae bacterium]
MPVKPSNKEEEYIARLEFEEKKKREEANRKKLLADERKRLKELHHMRCPKCGMELIEINYKKLKIDKCSACSGIWLDAGEFEAVTEMEKSALNKFFNVFKK